MNICIYNMGKTSRRLNWFFVFMSILIALVAFALGFMFVMIIYGGLFGKDAWLLKIAQCQVPVFLGLPIAGLCSSFLLLTFNREFEGSMEIKLPPGIEITGPAGPIILWVICFFIISVCMSFLWNSNFSFSFCSSIT